jgi:hypothetical protein
MLSWAFVVIVVVAGLLARDSLKAGQVGLSLLYGSFFFYTKKE